MFPLLTPCCPLIIEKQRQKSCRNEAHGGDVVFQGCAFAFVSQVCNSAAKTESAAGLLCQLVLCLQWPQVHVYLVFSFSRGSFICINCE